MFVVYLPAGLKGTLAMPDNSDDPISKIFMPLKNMELHCI